MVKGVDESDFLRSRTTFNLFLPENRFPGIIENLEVYEFHHVIFCGESGDHFGFVFPDSPLQITGYPSIKDGVLGVHHDVHEILAFHKRKLREASALKKEDLWEIRDCFVASLLAATGWGCVTASEAVPFFHPKEVIANLVFSPGEAISLFRFRYSCSSKLPDCFVAYAYSVGGKRPPKPPESLLRHCERGGVFRELCEAVSPLIFFRLHFLR